jgi:restriction system protein
MARSRKSSPADDLFEIIALLPWWAGVALAAVSYALLHAVAGQQVAITGAPGQIGSAITATFWKSLASVGQYVLPIICLAAALGSALGRRKRRALVNDVTSNDSANALEGMTWREFEMLVGEAFRLQGYQVVETGAAGADGGVDLVLKRERETFLVQCKQWKAYKVGVTVVRELFGVMAARGAAGGFVVTSGRFTREATEFASGRNLKLIEGAALMGLIKQAQSARVTAVPQVKAPLPVPVPPSQSSVLACPKCGGTMVRRTAKRGANAGGDFWGCQTYPTCRGVRSMD